MTRNSYTNQRGVILPTSVQLEPEFWHALRVIAYQQNMSLQALLGYIEVQPRSRDQPFASALRCYAIKAAVPHLTTAIFAAPNPRSRSR